MNDIIATITDSQLEIMKVLWKKRQPMSVAEITQELHGSEWKASTIKTLIRRLHEHGVLSMDQYGVQRYSPLITEEDYQKYQAAELVNRAFAGEAGQLISALYKGNMLKSSEIQKLRNLLEESLEDEEC